MSTIVSNLSLSIQKAATAGLLALTALILLGTSSAIAQQTGLSQTAHKPAAPVVAQPEEEETAVPNKPGEQGIKVHGHWVIDVKDKDGKVVEHRDFQNSLVPQGGALLVYLLAGSLTPSNLEVDVSGTAGSSNTAYYMYPTGNNATAYACANSGRNFPQNCNPTLNVTAGATANGTVLTLQGQFVSSSNVTVTDVYTFLGVCNPTVATASPVNCSTNAASYQPGSSGLTHANLTPGSATPPIAVAAGQTLAVTVTLSFS